MRPATLQAIKDETEKLSELLKEVDSADSIHRKAAERNVTQSIQRLYDLRTGILRIETETS